MVGGRHSDGGQGRHHYQKLLGLHGVVGVDTQLFSSQRDGLFELRG